MKYEKELDAPPSLCGTLAHTPTDELPVKEKKCFEYDSKNLQLEIKIPGSLPSENLLVPGKKYITPVLARMNEEMQGNGNTMYLG